MLIKYFIIFLFIKYYYHGFTFFNKIILKNENYQLKKFIIMNLKKLYKKMIIIFVNFLMDES